ncbi:uncharacterized protein LOC131938120 [Physella acuta]|uniref:uncharacterized protein LOC131938120 n=1 Tax=Physella acuta TaxID=109671 RepID=UPI0027DC9BED|nr:uncharacterized protein LOC131938120 [Physella acuta]
MENKITLLVVGRTGNGVTSVVYSARSGSNVIEEKSISVGEDERRVADHEFPEFRVIITQDITIIDGSGIGDCEIDSSIPDIKMRESVTKALEEVGGFDVLIFVLKYGTRFTKQEKDAVEKVKEYFGESIFRDRGIIVLSYGDNFSLDNEEGAFKEWCGSQVGEFKLLTEECENRVLLFDNRTNDEKVKSEQRQKLIETTCRIRDKFMGHYTVHDFKNQRQNYKPENSLFNQRHSSLYERNTERSCLLKVWEFIRRAVVSKTCNRIYIAIILLLIFIVLMCCLVTLNGFKL